MEGCLYSLARKRLAERDRESDAADRRIADAERWIVEAAEAEIAIETGRGTVPPPDAKGSADRPTTGRGV